MEEQMPHFKYYPTALEDNIFVKTDNVCDVCGEKVNFEYTGPIYGGDKDLREPTICPRCIADGSAHHKFNIKFNICEWYSAPNDIWENVPKGVVEEIEERTPGYTSWQGQRWWVHHDDAAIFLGRAGKEEIQKYFTEVIDILKKESGMSDDGWSDYYKAMDKDGDVTAYIFKCSKCGEINGYSDCN
jgi:hypothetical protein